MAASNFRTETSASGPMLYFTSVDTAYARGQTPPTLGWEERAMPALLLKDAARSKTGDPPTVWMRLRFDANAMRPGPLMLGLDHTGERMIIRLNGVDIFRNYGDDTARIFGWNRPWIASLPPQLLRPQGNEIIVRLDTNVDWNLGMGGARIGPDRELRDSFDRRYLARVQIPQLINGIILTWSFVVLVSWFFRKKDKDVLWLMLIGPLWWFRNLHYYVSEPPFDGRLFWDLTVYSMFALMIVLYGFAANFIGVPQKRKVIVGFSIVGILLIFLRFILLQRNLSDLICYALTVPMALSILYILGRAVWTKGDMPSRMMFWALFICICFSFHDFGIILRAWEGATFYLQPYGSLIVYGVWGMALFTRMFQAMGEVDRLNSTLERRIATATDALAKSEGARRKLEVSTAVNLERERLMMEIHDGIGSNLVTALSAAEKKNMPPETIAILRQSITDLKISVDSLEPIEGDVVSLLANLRHRLEPDLVRAGLSFDWRVDDAPALPWLDATGALHVLRILQEAIGNILAHSGASQILVECGPLAQEGREGISITIADKGCGFDPAAPRSGKGIANMTPRAHSLHGELLCETSVGNGTSVKLWLPVLPIRLRHEQERAVAQA